VANSPYERPHNVMISVNRDLLEKKIKSIPLLNDKLHQLLESEEITHYFEVNLVKKVSHCAKTIISINAKAYFTELTTKENLWENVRFDVIANLLQECIEMWTKIIDASTTYSLDVLMTKRLNSDFVKMTIDVMAVYILELHKKIKEQENALLEAKKALQASQDSRMRSSLFVMGSPQKKPKPS